MDETGQPGAATPGENDNGAGPRGDLARSGDEWAPSGSRWSPVGAESDEEPLPPPWRRPPSEPSRPGWADPEARQVDPSGPFRPVPAHLDGASPLERRKPRNGSRRSEWYESAQPVPLAEPPRSPGADHRYGSEPVHRPDRDHRLERSPASEPPHGVEPPVGADPTPLAEPVTPTGAVNGGEPDDRLAFPLSRPTTPVNPAAGEPPAPGALTDPTEAARHARDEPWANEVVADGTESTGQRRRWAERPAAAPASVPPAPSGSGSGFEPPPGFHPTYGRGPGDDGSDEPEQHSTGVGAAAAGRRSEPVQVFPRDPTVPPANGSAAGRESRDGGPVFSAEELDELMPRRRAASPEPASWRDVTPSPSPR
ncbi:MAG TPA: hypothetical protein VGD43_05340, partial [Micromonospora sp.]